MKKDYRIKNNIRFGEVVHQGKCKKNNSYTIHFLKNDIKNIRVGISVSKKIGKAVVRNKIKRQVRSMCDKLIDFQSNSFDIVIVIKKNYLDKTFNDNCLILSELLNTVWRAINE